ncbi:MAG: pyruvate dehydrogenase (acetyl-transferring) E1 component subunit alpha, partial [Pseudomonadota bacterium]
MPDTTLTELNTPYAVHAYPAQALIGALRQMYLIRKFEEGAEASYMRGLVHGTMHLSIGQEASAVAACMSLT